MPYNPKPYQASVMPQGGYSESPGVRYQQTGGSFSVPNKMTPGGGFDPGSSGNMPTPGAGLLPGEPQAPNFTDYPGALDPNTGKLLPAYSMNPENLAGYQQFQDLATGTGLSAYGQAAQDALTTQTGFEREGVQRAGQSAIQQAMGNLSRQGGLTSGARSRLQGQGIKDILAARQGVAGKSLLGGADIAMRDAGNRQKALGGLLDLGKSTRAADISTRLQEAESQRGFDMDKYKLDVAKFLAEQKSKDIAGQAGAAPGGGGGGGLLPAIGGAVGGLPGAIVGGLFGK